MTKKETDEVIMAACRDISDEYFRTYKEGKQILMQLPIPYDDNDFPVLVINPYYDGSGFIHIDDMGETSFHQMLTEAELDELCEAHDLSHGNIYENTPPFECAIYDVVKISELDKFVWKIIQLIRDSYLYVARHRIKG